MTTACSHDHAIGQQPAEAVNLALDAAQSRIVAAAQRLTAPRRRVLELLLTAGRPVKAYDLVAAFHADDRMAKPATVYRALEFLETMGLVHRLSSLKSFVACNFGATPHAGAFLICECCGSCREILLPSAAGLTASATALGYSIDRVTLEALGRCPGCLPTTTE